MHAVSVRAGDRDAVLRGICERNGLPANSETASAWARCRWRTPWSRVPAVRKRGRFQKGLGLSRKSGRCNLARSRRDRRSSHLLRPSWVDSPRNEIRPHERTPESSEAASHMDSPDRNWFAKLALYHNHSWCHWPSLRGGCFVRRAPANRVRGQATRCSATCSIGARGVHCSTTRTPILTPHR